MAKFKVVTQATKGAYAAVEEASHDLEMEALAPIGAELVVISAGEDAQFFRESRKADAIIVGRNNISKSVIDSLERCKVIAVGSVGTDRVDVAAATVKGIPVTNVPDIFIDEVADHTMMLVLATYRRLIIVDGMARDGRWGEGRPLLYGYPRIRGLTLGLISFGNVARAVAARAQPFGLHIVASDPYISELAMTRAQVQPVGLNELLQRSDLVSMHAPYTAETHHMLGEEQFRLMKPHSIFINTGRGDTVDEAALIRALQESWIGGAGLDVLEREPPEPKNPLLKMDKVVLSPHTASASSRMDPERRRRVGREIALVLSGRWPIACVNSSVLEKSALRRWRPYPME